MAPIQKVAIFGAGGSIGTHITPALIAAGFTVTIISRADSTTSFHVPENTPILHIDYDDASALSDALHGFDAVVSAVGVAGITKQKQMIDAAEKAGVGRFIVSDFGYGPHHQHLPEFEAIGIPRKQVLQHAQEKADGNPTKFSWSAIAIGNPIDWALKKFPTLGFDTANRKAIIYDSGTERFTGTTMAGIGAAVVGVLKHEEETRNKYLLVRSVETCQNELLDAFQAATGDKWDVQHDTVTELLARGRQKLSVGDRGWVLDLIVGQLLEEGKQRSVIADDKTAANKMLEIPDENVTDMVKAVVASYN